MHRNHKPATLRNPNPPSTTTSGSTATQHNSSPKFRTSNPSTEIICSFPAESFSNTETNNLAWRTLLSTSPPRLTPSSNICAGLASCPLCTGKLSLHRQTQAEIYDITSGRGIVSIEGTEHEVSVGSVLIIPRNAEHGVVIREGEALEWFYVFRRLGWGRCLSVF
ncbi:hypothetical protein BDW66DRAFT_4211 [Aspergillus desertorum]